MEYIEIGNLHVSRICMGTWNISGDESWGYQDEEKSIKTIKTALDYGVNFFDTAEAYGAGYSEEILGKSLSPVRDKVIIATKTSRISKKEIFKACENSLKRLKTDYIDIYYIHWPNWNIPIFETIEAMKKLEREGKIRMIGVSNFGKKDLKEVMEYYDVKINQLAYNLLFRAIEYEILPECIKRNVGVACYSPLLQGLLTGKFRSPEEVPEGRARTRHFSGSRPKTRHSEEGAEEETFSAVREIEKIAKELSVSMAELSLAWLLYQEGVSVVIAGARKPHQIEENAKASELKLNKDIILKLNRVTDNLKRKLGQNPDLWLSTPRIR